MVQVVLCNCDPQEAEALARRLVKEELAACVNILEGVKSVYRWKGELCVDEESTLLIKTNGERYEALEAAIEEYHSYDVPEIIALEAGEVSEAYGRWVDEQL